MLRAVKQNQVHWFLPVVLNRGIEWGGGVLGAVAPGTKYLREKNCSPKN